MPSKKDTAEKLYNTILKSIVEPIVGNRTTYSSALHKAGRELLGNKFVGVFPSDRIPKLTKTSPYCILNLDSSDGPGSHWIALAYSGDKSMVYDSFGRKHIKIIPTLKSSGNGVVIDTDRDPEQDIAETNCGARSISWLLLYDTYGPGMAKLI